MPNRLQKRSATTPKDEDVTRKRIPAEPLLHQQRETWHPATHKPEEGAWVAKHGSVASSVELVSNAVLVSGMDINNLGRMLCPWGFPSDILASMLHEITHWDTFATPVGEALAQVFASSWLFLKTEIEMPINMEESGVDPASESMLDFTRYTVTTDILRPLAEGMALFAEFDMMPDDSPVTTTMSRVVGSHFGGWATSEAVRGLTIRQLASVNLSDLRQTEAHISRKENLLCQPFRTIKGGYLPGYYFVKSLWIIW